MSITPARPHNPSDGAEPNAGGTPEIEVVFHLTRTDDWPPFPAETVTARLLGPDRARLSGIPTYADGISAGDLVRIDHDGAGFVGRDVLARGRHTTVHVVATDVAQLEQLSSALVSTGADMLISERTCVLAVDRRPGKA